MGAISLKYKSKSGNLTAPGDVDPGAMIPIATTAVGAGGAGTVTFSSIPQYYEHLQIRAIGRTTTNGNDAFRMRFNSDTGNNYGWHQLLGNGSSVISQGYTSQPQFGLMNLSASASATSGVFSDLVMDILDYSNTNKYKTIRTLTGYDNNGSGEVDLSSGVWMNTSAVSSINLFCVTGNYAEYSHFALYGIKRSGA